MRRKISILCLSLVLLVAFVSCGTNKAWRQATVTTYELVGVGIGASKDIGESLDRQGLIPQDQLLKIKATYNKARSAFIGAGNALKAASAAISSAEQGTLLEKYDVLLAEFSKVAYELYDLVKNFKKVSYLEILEAVKTGGEL